MPNVKVAGVARGNIWVSNQLTGTGAVQNVAHPLGKKPDAVFVVVTGTPASHGDWSVTEGTHTANNVQVTVTNGFTYKIVALSFGA